MYKLFMVIVLCCFLIIGCTTNDNQQENYVISIKGSDSEVNLVTALAENYMENHSNVMISVTGGGSGVGISSLIDGDIDIANSSRNMKEEEVSNALSKQGEEVYGLQFAIDGVAVIVNEKNSLEELTLEQIGKIYRGEITNWQEVGGENAPITLYGRQSTSGTYVFFMETVVKGEYSSNKRNLGGNSEIAETIINDLTGIGYIAIGYAEEDGLKVLKVAKDENSQSYSPLILENITSGNYPLTRPLYQFIIGKPNQTVLDFFKYEISEQGQAVVLKEGFYPIGEAEIEFNQKILN